MKMIEINTNSLPSLLRIMERGIKKEVIGQDRAIRHILRAISAELLKDPKRPIGGFIFAGPTGVGKTYLAKVVARYFLGGNRKYGNYLTRIDCSSLSRPHDVKNLTGAPPSYVGYGIPSP